MSDTSTLTASTPSARRTYAIRAVAALVWAGALAITLAASDSLSTAAALPALLAVLLVAYPVIDLVATVVAARSRTATRTPLLVNAAISTVAAVALAVAASHGTDAVLLTFGVWAVLTGVIQLGVAIVRRRSGTPRQLPMILSGGISTLAGTGFVQMAGQDDPSLANLAGYAAAGAVFFLLAARRPGAQR